LVGIKSEQEDEMNELMVANSTGQRMTSVQVAELTGKKHPHVMRDIRTLIDQEAINESNFGLVEYSDAKGEKRPMYSLDFHSTMVLVTGYDAKKRSAVINRWMALEQGISAPRLPTNYKEALADLLNQVEENEKLTLQIEAYRPMVDLATAITKSSRSIKIGEYAKVISNQEGFVIGQNNLFEWLRFERILDIAVHALHVVLPLREV